MSDEKCEFDEATLKEIAERAEYAAGGVELGASSDGEILVYRYVRRYNQLMVEKARVTAQMTSILRGLDYEIRGLNYQFENFAKDYLQRNLRGKARSLKTPWGTIGFRKKPASLEIKDHAALVVAYLAGELPDDVAAHVEEIRISKSALNKLFATGEIPPGCDVTPESDTFYVK